MSGGSSPSPGHNPCRDTARSRWSARTVRDTELKTQISRVHTDNFSVYGVRKIWRQLHREGIPVARRTGLMRDLGLQGARRGKKIRTTIRGEGHERRGPAATRLHRVPAE
ncbi:IS3 family transposase [Streptomyces avermitilis]|uniref:IS3 family transposase n=1 Tax=Streptomyces avermitilis TaxID=33903 RepID=UPI00367D0611